MKIILTQSNWYMYEFLYYSYWFGGFKIVNKWTPTFHGYFDGWMFIYEICITQYDGTFVFFCLNNLIGFTHMRVYGWQTWF